MKDSLTRVTLTRTGPSGPMCNDGSAAWNFSGENSDAAFSSASKRLPDWRSKMAASCVLKSVMRTIPSCLRKRSLAGDGRGCRSTAEPIIDLRLKRHVLCEIALQAADPLPFRTHAQRLADVVQAAGEELHTI